MKDFLGTDIKPEQQIVHCQRMGSRIRLSKGTIKAIKAPYIFVDFGRKKLSKIRRTDHCVVLP